VFSSSKSGTSWRRVADGGGMKDEEVEGFGLLETLEAVGHGS